MRLISCYIEHYGSIEERTYRFDEGLTVFCEENGAGKTTLASFIKAMFYGLEPYRSNAKEFCDRQHFHPFGGGSFGGNLTFEWEGHVYKIERFFGEKSDLSDTLTVYCDGEVTERFSEEIGKEVFGIDKASFERTLFIDSREIECAATTDIGARLNNFLQGVAQPDFDRAMSALEQAALVLKKKRGNDDRIGRQKALISELEEKLRNAERVQSGLNEKYEKSTENQTKMAVLAQKITDAQTLNARLENWAHYEYLLQETEQSRAARSAIEERYPAGLPAQTEIEQLRDLLEARRQNRILAENSAFSKEDEEILQRLLAKFEKGVPEEGQLSQLERDIQRLTALTAELAAQAESTLTEEERALLVRFDAHPVSDKELSDLTQKTQAMCDAKKAYEAAFAAPVSQTATEKKVPNGMGKYGILAVILAVISLLGVCMVPFFKGVGLLVSVLGVVALLVVGFLYLNRKASAHSEKLLEEKRIQAMQSLALAWRSAELAAASVLARYGCGTEQGVEVAFYGLCRDVSTYRQLSQRETKRLGTVREKSAERDALEDKLSRFFALYYPEYDSYIHALSGLRAQIGTYRSQSARKKLAVRGREELEKKEKALEEQIRAFGEKYQLNELDVQRMFDDLAASAAYSDAILRGEKAAQQYRTEKSLTEKPQGAPLDIEMLNAELRELQRANSILLREIDADEQIADTVSTYRGECAAAREQLALYIEKHRLLTAAMTELQGAEQGMKDRYFKPVRGRFLHYAELIECAIGERVCMSGNFKVTFERHGKERSEKHLSMGQRSICALCFRLALMENMYDGKIPFLVMDDPFVALDAVHLERVREVMREIAKDTQILYFCCHESRNM